MKKVNAKGFTLIELLAVITIMGILMIVAIPAVTRTIENSRKDMFINTVQNYVNALSNMWASDSLRCVTPDNPSGYLSSAVPAGFYYIEVDSSSDSVPQLLESGGKSPWGNRDMKGYIYINVYDIEYINNKVTREIRYYPVIVDGIHGVNVRTDGKSNMPFGPTIGVQAESLVRGNLVMSGASYDIVLDTSTGKIKPTWEIFGNPVTQVLNLCVDA